MKEVGNMLLCTFCKTHLVEGRIEDIKNKFKIKFNRIYVLHVKNQFDESLITYNIDLNENEKNYKDLMSGTINLHRKKESNTLYTINALNEIIKQNNNGVLDKNYPVVWENYANSILLYTNDKLKILPTVLKKIVYVNE